MRYYDDFPIPEIGDRVLVRHDLEQKRYSHLHDEGTRNSVTSEMYWLAGQYVTIRDITGIHQPETGDQYVIEELRGVAWVTDMFDLSEFMIKPIDISKDDLMEFLK